MKQESIINVNNLQKNGVLDNYIQESVININWYPIFLRTMKLSTVTEAALNIFR